MKASKPEKKTKMICEVVEVKTGLFLITSNADNAEKLKNAGYQLAAVNGSSFIFIDNPDIKFNFENMGICRTSNLTF